MNIKRICCAFLVAALLVAAFPFSAFAASSVVVSLPKFPVTLGGQTISPQNEEYPFIVYKDITYLPLTYYGCQLLGLYSEWTRQTGLSISDLGAKGKYVSTPNVSSNTGRLTAKIATGPITINKTSIDNTKQQYPFLLFRDITYIPMTWNNMHDILGCEYSFDSKNGLVIDRKTQNGSILRLPLREDFYSIASYAGYFWYVDTNGNISRTPMSGGPSELVFEVPINYYTELKPAPSLSVRDDALYMTYHIGGAIMGSDVQIRFRPDGTFESLGGSGIDEDGNIIYYGTKNIYLECEKYRIAASYFAPPINDNLSILYAGSDEWKQLGEEQYIYSWYVRQVEDGGMSCIMTNDLYERDGVLYTLGMNYFAGEDPENLTGPYYERYKKYCDPNVGLPNYSCVVSVDIASGKTTELTEHAMRMKLIGDEIWYVTAPDGALKKCALDGTHVETIVAKSEGPVADFWVINDTVFFTTYYNDESVSIVAWLYKVVDSGDSKGVQRIGLTPPSSVTVQGDYLLALMRSAEEIADYPVPYFSSYAALIRNNTSIPRLVVYDSKAIYAEDSLFSINDTNILAAGIADDKLYYVVK